MAHSGLSFPRCERTPGAAGLMPRGTLFSPLRSADRAHERPTQPALPAQVNLERSTGPAAKTAACTTPSTARAC